MTYSMFSLSENNNNLFAPVEQISSTERLQMRAEGYITPITVLFYNGLFFEARELIIETRGPFMSLLYQFEEQFSNDPLVIYYVDYFKASFEMLAHVTTLYNADQSMIDKLLERVKTLDDPEKLKALCKQEANQTTGILNNITIKCTSVLEINDVYRIYMKEYSHLFKNGIFEKSKLDEIRNKLEDSCRI